MTFEIDKLTRDKLVNAMDTASRKLNDWIKSHGDRGTMGLLSNETKNEPIYKSLNSEFNTAKNNLDTFLKKTKFNTKYKKELMIDKVSTQYLPNGKKNIYYDPSSKLFKKEESKMKIIECESSFEVVSSVWWDNLDKADQQRYIKIHPTSKFATKIKSEDIKDKFRNKGKLNNTGLIRDHLEKEGAFDDDNVPATHPAYKAIKKIIKDSNKESAATRANGVTDEQLIKAINVFLEEHTANRFSLKDNKLLDLHNKSVGKITLLKGEIKIKLSNGKQSRILISETNSNLNTVYKVLFSELERKLSPNLEQSSIKQNNENSSMKNLETANDWWDKLSLKEQQTYVETHPNSAHAKHAKNILTPEESHKHSINYNDSDESKKKLLNHRNAVSALGYSFVNNIQKNKNPPKQDSDLKKNAQLLLNEISEAEDKFDKAHKAGDTAKAIEFRKAINIYKEGYKKLTGKEYFLHHELSSTKKVSTMKIIKCKTNLEIASDWFEALPEKQQKDYIEKHPDSKFAHKVGTGKEDKTVLKDPKKIKEHLEGEGIDTKKSYYGLSNSNQAKIHTTLHRSGKGGSTGLGRTRAYEKITNK